MDCYKDTKSEWYPSYGTPEQPLVWLSLGTLDKDDGEPTTWYISGSGQDDYDRQVLYTNENLALCEYMGLLGLASVDYSDFDKLSGTEGFT
jgi:hypothetical protein